MTDIDALTEDDHEQGIDESIEDQSEIAQISVDIIETGMELVILAPLSGSKLEDIDIKLKQGSLIIS
ncbi:MAG: hypothetical protein U9Q15_00760 [Patescibacteria group bacterium]|nr:hypothetical protein [Patescibacteria group bacterium]